MQEIAALLGRNRRLLWELTRREISDRYAGQILGPIWAIGHPLLLISIYLFIFVVVFQVKVEHTSGLPLNYAVYLLSGLIPWLAVQEAMTKGAVALVSSANLVKQVVFPIEILPVKGVLAALLPLGVSLMLLLVYCGLALHVVPWTWVLVPLLVALLATGLIGISMALAAVGAYVRDLKDLVQVFSVVGVYLMPTFYLPTMVPELFRPILWFNPFSYMVWCFQDAIYFGELLHPWAWLVFPALCLLSFLLGFRLFEKLKTHIGNVL